MIRQKSGAFLATPLPAGAIATAQRVPAPTYRQSASVAEHGGQAAGRSSLPHYLMLVYLFLYCSRLPELIPQVRISALLLLVLVSIMAINLQFAAITRIPGGRLLLALTAWSIVCIPFSVWPGGSFEQVQGAIRTLITIALVPAFVRTTREAIRAVLVVGMAMGFAAALSFWSGSTDSSSGRLVLAYSSTLGDPNYYCYYVLAGLPFLCLGAALTSGVKRIGFLLLILPILNVVAKTGSRMGAIAFAAGILFMFFVAPVRYKILLTIGTAALVMLAIAILPSHLRQRFTTMFESEEDTTKARMATESSESRRYLFFRSLEITAQNPIFGVGAGMFSIAEGALAKEEGVKGAWHATHNTYTQYSSELGIPGMLLYVSVLYASYNGLRRIRKSHLDPRMSKAALFTQMAFVVVCVSLMFLSVGYGGIPYILVAVSGCLQVTFANEAMSKKNQPIPAIRRTLA